MPSTELSAFESEVLSPAEVEQLVAETVGGPDAAPRAEARREPSAAGRKREPAQPFAFRGESFLTPHELRAFRSEHELIIGTLGARLSSYLRAELGLRLCEVQALPYQKFVQALSTPCHLTLFKVEPWRGICLLDLSPKLALAISDRVLGGKGVPPAQARELSAVESALLDQVVQHVLNEWCGHWTKFQPLSPTLLGHENSPRFLRVSQPETMIVTVAVEARLGECVEQIQFAFPGATLELILQELRLKSSLRLDETPPLPTGSIKWRNDFDTIPVPISVSWSGLKLTTGQLARLAVGQVIDLPPEFSSRVRLSLAGAAKFSGRLGTCENTWAVEITEVLRA